MKKITILGSTGSIGTQAIEICDKHGLEIVALAANSNAKMLAELSEDLGEAMVGINEQEIDLLMAERGK